MLAISSRARQTSGMQGHSESNRELLDAAAPCRQLLAAPRADAFLAHPAPEPVPGAAGVGKTTARRALDSTLLDDAVATQDTVTPLISAIRRVRRVIPGAASLELIAHDYDAGAKPTIAWDDPVAKAGLVSALVT